MPAVPEPPRPTRGRWRDPMIVQTVAAVLVGAAASWFLLIQLEALLRPLLLAVILAYILMPYHSRLRTRVGAPASIVLLAGLTAGALFLVALGVYGSVLGLSEDWPALKARALDLFHVANNWVSANAPWLVDESVTGKRLEERLADGATSAAQPVLNAAADALIEAFVVGLYLLFLLLEASRFPDRLRRAYSRERADELLNLAGQVNAAIVSYLRAKVKSSLVLAVPVGLVLAVCGVEFAFLWAMLTFLCNFIPYLGSVVAYTLPVGFAFLQLDPGWRPVTAAVLLLGCHVGSASLVEPTLLGRAVGLSPLVILASLTFWGLLWGIAGMFLAVPLTVVAVIVLEHMPFTRPVARLTSGE